MKMNFAMAKGSLYHHATLASIFQHKAHGESFKSSSDKKVCERKKVFRRIHRNQRPNNNFVQRMSLEFKVTGNQQVFWSSHFTQIKIWFVTFQLANVGCLVSRFILCYTLTEPHLFGITLLGKIYPKLQVKPPLSSNSKGRNSLGPILVYFSGFPITYELILCTIISSLASMDSPPDLFPFTDLFTRCLIWSHLHSAMLHGIMCLTIEARVG